MCQSKDNKLNRLYKTSDNITLKEIPFQVYICNKEAQTKYHHKMITFSESNSIKHLLIAVKQDN